MSATTDDVLEAFAYYIGHGGYVEKKDGDTRYLTRAVENFHKNDGDGNYTYMGRLCGINPGAWCAMMVSTAVYEGCGSDLDAAREALWGVWPYASCGQLWDAAPDRAKHWSRWQLDSNGRSGSSYAPAAGDVIIFTNDGKSRDHTGMIYAVDGDVVYTYEGNSGNMARKRSYDTGSSYIYGYVNLNLSGGSCTEIQLFQRWLGVTADGVYGPVTKKAAIRAHQQYLIDTYGAKITADGVWGPMTYYATRELRQGDDSEDAAIWQGLLYCAGFDPRMLDGSYGTYTRRATEDFQAAVGLHPTGVADRYTWARMFGSGKPEHTILRTGSTGPEVRYLQRLLTDAGYPTATDGTFGERTEASVKAFQTANGLTADGIANAATQQKLWSMEALGKADTPTPKPTATPDPLLQAPEAADAEDTAAEADAIYDEDSNYQVCHNTHRTPHRHPYQTLWLFCP